MLFSCLGILTQKNLLTVVSNNVRQPVKSFIVSSFISSRSYSGLVVRSPSCHHFDLTTKNQKKSFPLSSLSSLLSSLTSLSTVPSVLSTFSQIDLTSPKRYFTSLPIFTTTYSSQQLLPLFNKSSNRFVKNIININKLSHHHSSLQLSSSHRSPISSLSPLSSSLALPRFYSTNNINTNININNNHDIHNTLSQHQHQHHNNLYLSLGSLLTFITLLLLYGSHSQEITANELTTTANVTAATTTSKPNSSASTASTASTASASLITPLTPSAQSKQKPFLIRLLYSLIESILVSIRMTELFLRFSPPLVTAPIVFLLLSPSSVWRQRWWDLCVYTIESCGPTFIKLAQWASSRRDLFPASMCAQLSRLHGRSKKHSFNETLKIVESSLGYTPVDQVFAGIEREPIGSGCVAQVHKAVLAGSGDVVVIKVLHPGVRYKIEQDILILDLFAKILESIVPSLKWLSLVECVENFSTLMTQQLDLSVEGANLAKFKKNFENVEGVRFPTPYLEFSSDTLLVESYEPSVSLNRFIRDPNNPLNFELGELGLHGFLKMMIIDNFIHGDLHPGNMLVQQLVPITPESQRRKKDIHQQLSPNAWFAPSVASSTSSSSTTASSTTTSSTTTSSASQSATQMEATTKDEQFSSHNSNGYSESSLPTFLSLKWLTSSKVSKSAHPEKFGLEPVAYSSQNDSGNIQLMLIDAGIVTELSPADRKNFIDLFTAVAKGNGRSVAEMMIDRARDQQCTDREGFINSVDNLVQRVRRETFKLGTIRIADILNEMFSLVCAYRVKMESNFVSLAVSIMVLEGIGRSLNPSIDLLVASLPLLESLKSDQGLLEGHISENQATAIRTAIRVYTQFKWIMPSTNDRDPYSSANPIVLFGME